MNLFQEKIMCLGKEFSSEDERRDYFRNELRAKLPELKLIEGFPIGEDEDIIALSDPPYYTACPNPWLNEFVTQWEKEKASIPGRMPDFVVDEPYAADVSEGKTNQLYAAHSYHTKVPHPAIMRYILHYTQPGDIVYDGFSGTGMTAVAAISCENPDLETKFKIESEWKAANGSAPKWGARKSIIGDLSPIASFIAYNYISPKNLDQYEKEFTSILADFERDLGWMYKTIHTNGRVGQINYVVWSEVLSCPHCNHEFSFTELFYDPGSSSVLDTVKCQSCLGEITKNSCSLLFETVLDHSTNLPRRKPKRIPYKINYSFGSKSYFKKPDEQDVLTIKRIESLEFPKLAPILKIPDIQMIKVGRMTTTNVNYIHDFFLYRSLQALGYFWEKSLHTQDYKTKAFLLFTVEQMIWGISLLNRFRPTGFSQVNQYLSGVFYIASHTSEISPKYLLEGKYRRLIKAFSKFVPELGDAINYCGDCSLTNIAPESVDYIFTDPPFGENIYYSDLNILIEAWHKVITNPKNEAIVDKVKAKTILTYQTLMEKCFHKYFTILKSGKWMTVEFSNTSAAVWNGIQTALQRAGFVIANVSSLDKKQGTFQAVNSPTAVKQDLVISCYKPSKDFEASFTKESGAILIWDFVREHLQHLPVHTHKGLDTTAIIERSPKILYDRLISYYLMRDFPVPIDAIAFQVGLLQRFVERDGMFFLQEQAAEYDEKKSKTSHFVQMALIPTNESEAIEWLKERLRLQPQKYNEIMPDFRIATRSIRKGDSLPELQDILDESFIKDADGRYRTPDLNQAKEREEIRNKALLKEFNRYLDEVNKPKAKKLKEVRVEALRAGFKHSFEKKDFKTIMTLGDKIPQNILLEDEVLLMYYDIAKDRV